jgi:hypothetical protein
VLASWNVLELNSKFSSRKGVDVDLRGERVTVSLDSRCPPAPGVQGDAWEPMLLRDILCPWRSDSRDLGREVTKSAARP